MSIIVHRNVNVAQLLEGYNAEMEPADHYNAARVLCLDHMGEAWDDWPEGCEPHLVCYIGHKINTTDAAVADVFIRIAPSSPAFPIEDYLEHTGAELYTHNVEQLALPCDIDYSMLGSDGR